MSVCRKCGRPRDNSRESRAGRRKRNRAHICPTVVIQSKEKVEATGDYRKITVHEDRVAKGGDLYEKVTGEDATYEVVFRNRQKIEKKIEKRKKKNGKSGGLVAPSGDLLLPPDAKG